MAARRLDHPVLQGALARGLALVPAALATLVSTRLILEHYDEVSYNTFILAFSTMVLIPLNGLGAGTSVVNAVAERGVDHPHTQAVLLTASRIMTLSGLALGTVSLGASIAGWWPAILGDGAAPGASFGIGLLIYGLTFVPALGQSVLLGVNRNHVSIAVQALLAPLMALGVVACVVLDASPSVLVLVPAASVGILAVVNAAVASRLTHLRWLPLLLRVPRIRRHPGTRIRSVAGPALVVSITGPLALQTDRLVLSHLSSESALTTYSITVQLFAPLLTVVVAAAQPIWPAYSRARATGSTPPSMRKLTALFSGLSLAAGAAIVALSGPAARIVGGPGTDLGWATPVAMGVLVVGQSMTLPVAMAVRDAPGLRLAAWTSAAALPLNLGLSILLAPRMGAAGPLLATILVGTPLQGIPMLVHFARRRHHDGVPTTAPTPGDDEPGEATAPPDLAPPGLAGHPATDPRAAALGLPTLADLGALAPGRWTAPNRTRPRR